MFNTASALALQLVEKTRSDAAEVGRPSRGEVIAKMREIQATRNATSRGAPFPGSPLAKAAADIYGYPNTVDHHRGTLTRHRCPRASAVSMRRSRTMLNRLPTPSPTSSETLARVRQPSLPARSTSARLASACPASTV
jgi:hypothetical protein